MMSRLRGAATRWIARAARPTRGFDIDLVDGVDASARGAGRTVAIAPSEYTGVLTSTRRLFPATVAVGAADLVLPSDRTRLAAAIESARPEQVVFSGWLPGFADVARALCTAKPTRPVRALWHGTPLQLADVDERRQFDELIGLARGGTLDRVGFFKTGLAPVHAARGVPAVEVFNPPPVGPPEAPPKPHTPHTPHTPRGPGELRLGLFAAGPSWRKNPYAMLVAAAQLEGAAITGVLDPAAQAYAREIGLFVAQARTTPFAAEALAKAASEQDCNLYVTLSECSPLFPLESLHRGVPCLIGPSSHLFLRCPSPEAVEGPVAEAARLLEERLVVARPEDPASIAASIRRAVEARDAILEAYRTWLPAYDAAARVSIDRFLSIEATSPS